MSSASLGKARQGVAAPLHAADHLLPLAVDGGDLLLDVRAVGGVREARQLSRALVEQVHVGLVRGHVLLRVRHLVQVVVQPRQVGHGLVGELVQLQQRAHLLQRGAVVVPPGRPARAALAATWPS